MNNADLIVAILRANGITRGFGIPSGNVLPLMEAMRKGGVEFVLTASLAFRISATRRRASAYASSRSAPESAAIGGPENAATAIAGPTPRRGQAGPARRNVAARRQTGPKLNRGY